MRVGINVFPFSSKSFSGHNPYTRDLIAALVKHEDEHEYFVLTSPENHDYFALSAKNCDTICIHEVLPALPARLEGSRSESGTTAELQRQLPPTIERSRSDSDVPTAGADDSVAPTKRDDTGEWHCHLYDCIDSLSLNVLFCPWIDAEWEKISVPSVVVVADILQEYHPEVLSEEENAWRHGAFRRACREASQVACISEFTRKTVIERFGAAPEKVHTAPSAVSQRFNIHEAKSSWSKVQQQFGLESGYLFLPATTWAHKNHLRLLSALGELKSRGMAPQLVLTGGDKMPREELMAAASQAGCADQVHHLGFIDQQFMPGLYYGAACLVFPSVFEGFGLPAVEAMSLGCPLLCSDIEVFREVVGDAAVTFDPLDPTAIADAIERVIGSQELQEDLRRRGLARAAEFNWPRVASACAKILEVAAGIPAQRPVKPFLQGIYPDNWTGPYCFIKRIDSSRYRELLVEGDVPAGCNNVTVAILCNGVCVTALHSQEPGRFSHRVDWADMPRENAFIDVELQIDRQIVPKALGLSADERQLSFLVLSLTLFDREGHHLVLRGKYDPADYALSADSGLTSKLSERKAQ